MKKEMGQVQFVLSERIEGMGRVISAVSAPLLGRLPPVPNITLRADEEVSGFDTGSIVSLFRV